MSFIFIFIVIGIILPFDCITVLLLSGMKYPRNSTQKLYGAVQALVVPYLSRQWIYLCLIWYTDRYSPYEGHWGTESHFRKIQDSCGHYLGFGFLAITRSPMKIFASNLVCRWIVAIQGLCCPENTSFGKIQDGGSRYLGFEFLAISHSPIKIFASNLVHR